MGLAVVSDTGSSSLRRRVDVREVIGELRRLHPKAGEETLAVKLAERLDEDHHLLLDASRALIWQTLASVATGERLRKAAPSPRQRLARQEAEKVAVREIAGKVRETVLLDLMMPNGVAVRYCSGTQMAGLGRAYEKIAERVGAAMVGEVMVEAEVRALLCA